MAVRAEWTRRRVDGLVRVWSSAAGAPRLRRPTDILLLVGSIFALGLLALGAPGPTGADDALATLLAWLQPVLGWLWSVVYAVMTLWALGVVLLAAASRGRRRLLVDQATASALAVGASIGVGALAGTHPSDIVDGLVSSGPPVVYVASRVALLTAVIVTASPHLARPWRYASRVVIALGAVAAIGLNATNLLGASAGIAVGIAAAAITHLVLGSPQGRLTDAQVQIALADLGVPTTRVAASPDPTAVNLLIAGTEQDGRAAGHALRARRLGQPAGRVAVGRADPSRRACPDLGHATVPGRARGALHAAGVGGGRPDARRRRGRPGAPGRRPAGDDQPTRVAGRPGRADAGRRAARRDVGGGPGAEHRRDRARAHRQQPGRRPAGRHPRRWPTSTPRAGLRTRVTCSPTRPGSSSARPSSWDRTERSPRRSPPSARTASRTCCPTCSPPRSGARRARTSGRGPGPSTSCARQRSPLRGSRSRRWNACGG